MVLQGGAQHHTNVWFPAMESKLATDHFKVPKSVGCFMN